MTLEFHLNGRRHAVRDVPPNVTALDYIREHLRLTGTKEGCAEGDCGACTVVLAAGPEDALTFRAVNACLLTLPHLNGADVLTVEGLAGGGGLDPVQAAMADGDGTQCGYCTPGFVMALYALRRGPEEIGGEVDPETVHDALAGNLCRCTGYRPIVDAAVKACGEKAFGEAGPGSDGAHAPAQVTDRYEAGGQAFLSPAGLDEMARALADEPDAYILAGGTDLGLLAAKERQKLPIVIHTGRVAELLEIRDEPDFLEFGAAVTYTDALPLIERDYPSFATLIRRIGSRQIRNMGTIGGNIGNASPIGDTPPGLIALDAVLSLHSRDGSRQMPIEDFFLDYRKTDLRPGEFIRSVRIPKLKDGEAFRTYKISKRYDQDISSVIGAYRVAVADGAVRDARIAYGGMAATPKRARASEAALTGSAWTEDALMEAARAIDEDFEPLSDHRASAAYRSMVAKNLFARLWRDVSAVDETIDVALIR